MALLYLIFLPSRNSYPDDTSLDVSIYRFSLQDTLPLQHNVSYGSPVSFSNTVTEI